MDTPDEQMENWEERIVCADDSCIGTIGADGRCRVCGKASLAEEHSSTVDDGEEDVQSPENEIRDTSDSDPVEGQSSASIHEEHKEADADDVKWEERTLCPDESCVGTIGSDGCCNICGRAIHS